MDTLIEVIKVIVFISIMMVFVAPFVVWFWYALKAAAPDEKSGQEEGSDDN